jgi:hypothetical protein
VWQQNLAWQQNLTWQQTRVAAKLRYSGAQSARQKYRFINIRFQTDQLSKRSVRQNATVYQKYLDMLT